ncbi:MAG: DUF2341 domain-containing protein, partial [Candidatus Pacebacteria bacterium]|nr:DUF2341 domain-containing protein [Candidatus Paceibacterota bacterium]
MFRIVLGMFLKKRFSGVCCVFKSKSFLVFLFVISCLYSVFGNIVPVSADGAEWYDAEWFYRKEVTIDHTQVVNENLTDFPFLFDHTDYDFISLSNDGKVGNDEGLDILFTLSDGTTKLSHEIEEYDASSGKLVAWVKIPELSYEADTKIYVYYGNSSAADQQDTENVWDSNYKMVQHLNEAPANGTSGGHQDSTSNGVDGTSFLFYDISTTDGEGKIGGADIFKDSMYAPYYYYNPVYYYSRIDLPDSVLNAEESFTISSWIKSNAEGTILSNNSSESTYCSVSAYTDQYYYLQRVAFNTIYNSSTAFTGNAYTDYTDVSTTVQAGSTYTLTTTNAPYMHHSVRVWFDFNQDGDFDDDGEEFLVTAESSYQIGHSISVTIPTTALNGSTRMRVRARYNGYFSNATWLPDDCDYNTESETEDYTIIIEGSEYSKEGNTIMFGSFDAGKFSITKDGTAYDVVGDANLNDSEWHYLSATYGASGMKLYVDGELKDSDDTVFGSLSTLRSGFWIGRYNDNRAGDYGFDGTIDEVRVSVSERGANWIQTEYNNQDSSGVFSALSAEESRVMNHFSVIASDSEVDWGDSVTLTITAINNEGEVFTPYSGNKTITFSGASADGAYLATATDNTGNALSFGQSVTLSFVDGVAITTLVLYRAETANIQLTDNSYSLGSPISIIVRSQGGVFVAPSRPSTSSVRASVDPGGVINQEVLSDDIKFIAVSKTEDFDNSSWERINGSVDLKSYGFDIIYVKFRTSAGGVSDIVKYSFKNGEIMKEDDYNAAEDVSICDGDIVKTADSLDVYVIKIIGDRKYKRIILSPNVFQSYGHLKW